MIRAEWITQWRRRRTWIVLAAAAGFPLILTVALWATGSGRPDRVGDLPLVIVPRQSGLTVPLIALSSTMRFFLPLLVAVVAGEAIAGDTAAGSLRYALSRPVSRTRFLLSKALATAGVTSIAILVLAVAALLVGLAFFGWHPLRPVNGDQTASGASLAYFSPGAAVGRLAISVLYVAAGMASVFTFGFFLSTLTSRPIIAVFGAAALSVVSRVFNGDYLPGVASVSPYMPNQDIDLWQHLFTAPADTTNMARFLLLQLAYAAVFLMAAWWTFTRRDVLA